MVTYTDFKPFAARMMSVFYRSLTDSKPFGVEQKLASRGDISAS